MNQDYTILEAIKSEGGTGNVITTAEILREDNEILEDAVWMPSNNKMSHRTLVRTRMPQGTKRLFNQGVNRSVATRELQEDVIMLYRAESAIDDDIVEVYGNDATRADNDRGIVMGMGIGMAEELCYGDNTTDPASMTGFIPRLDAVDNLRVFSQGGSGSDLMSAVLVQWGPGKCYISYPEGTTAGLSVRDLGLREVTDAVDSTKKFWAEVTRFDAKMGLVVEDPQCIARVANIETSGTSNIFDSKTLRKALFKMRNRGKNAVIYVNDTLYTQIADRVDEKSNMNFFWSNPFGEDEDILTFHGRPIRSVDRLRVTESAVS
jgi:hypothetical protein